MIVGGAHDPGLVTLSIAIAILASFTALSLSGRIRASRGRLRGIWLAAAAVTLGGGIWSMHFVAMLAFSIPTISISYDLVPTLASLFLAMGLTGAGLATFDWQQVSRHRIVLAGLLIATGVVAMHYVGMSGMRLPAMVSYQRSWVTVSVIIAIVAATAAMWLASRDQRTGRQLLAAAVMGGAISGMHYAGMHAAVFTLTGAVGDLEQPGLIDQPHLAIAVSAITGLILLVSLGAAQLERAFRRAARREARIALRLKVADILRGDDPSQALGDVAALLGVHFDVARAGMGDLDPDEDAFDYSVCWTDGVVPPLIGRFPAAAFGVQIVEALKSGETVVIDDLFTSDLSDEARTRETARTVETRAILVVPFVRNGRLRTIVYLNDRRPRAWRTDEVAFIQEMAERIRLVIERVAVEDQLRDLNASLEARVASRTLELQRTESAHRAVDALYRAYFENMPDPLFVVTVVGDGAFEVEQVNPAYEINIGHRLDDIRGKRIDAFLAPEVAARITASYRHVVDTKGIYQYRSTLTLGENLHYWDTTLVPLMGPDGTVSKIIGSSRDVTAQLAAEEALRQSQKMEAMGQLTGGVAHDFNNLLTPIMGALDRLYGKGVGDERDKRLLWGALQSAERAKTLVHRLLSFARRQPLHAAPVDISDLVDGMRDLISSTIGPKLHLEIDTPMGLAAATADANQLEMALLNLSVNARDAMPEGGTLRVSVSRATVDGACSAGPAPGNYICLVVADTGTGMDEETRKRAIEPFFSTKGVGRGTGLGLSMAHGLAAQLGGALTIDSAPGQGTKICLWLAESGRAPETAGSPIREHAPQFGGLVLLVEDEEVVRESTAEMLIDLGYEVTQATSAEDALALIDKGLKPDVIVSDHIMPGMTGTQLVRSARQRLPAARMLIISGYTEESGIDPDLPRLTKPFLKADLAAALAALH